MGITFIELVFSPRYDLLLITVLYILRNVQYSISDCFWKITEGFYFLKESFRRYSKP